jgi:hypothetical protein
MENIHQSERLEHKTRTFGQAKSSAQREQMNSSLKEAVERIYRAYGPNLNSFFRDAQQELSKCGK